MKNLKLILMFIAAGSFVMMTSCKGKDGAPGPAGADGIVGVNGTNANAISAVDQAAFDAADGLVGGRLYDNFIAELSLTDPTLTANPNFFRCKQCHGWDLRGSNGAYINRAPSATRPDVAPNDLYSYAQTHDIKELFNAIKHTGGRARMSGNKSLTASMPDYGLLLTDAQIWELTKFLQIEAFNTFKLYDITTVGSYPTGTRTFTNLGTPSGVTPGDAVAGNAMFASDCAGCHGATGTQIALDGGVAYMGDFMRNSPYEFQHKAHSGNPGSSMPTFADNVEQVIRDFLVAGQDTVAYPYHP